MQPAKTNKIRKNRHSRRGKKKIQNKWRILNNGKRPAFKKDDSSHCS